MNLPEGNIPQNARLKRIVRLVGILMDGDASPGLQARIRKWFAKAGGSPIIDEGIVEYSESLEPGPLPMTGETLRRYNAVATKIGLPLEGKPAPVRRLRRVPAFWRVAAVAIPFMAFAATAYFYDWFAPDTRAIDNPICVAALIDSQKHIVLPDGSGVWLKEGSSINYSEAFTDDRLVELSGEGFFDVAKMDGKPFRVKTPVITVTVTGTQFNMRDFGTDRTAEITLLSGSVDVEAGRKSYTLAPSERLTMDKQTRDIEVEVADDYRQAADWRSTVGFEDATLRKVFDYMASYYHKSFVVEGVDLTGDPVTIEFGPDLSLDDALTVLSKTYRNFTFEISGDTVSIQQINK